MVLTFLEGDSYFMKSGLGFASCSSKALPIKKVNLKIPRQIMEGLIYLFLSFLYIFLSRVYELSSCQSGDYD